MTTTRDASVVPGYSLRAVVVWNCEVCPQGFPRLYANRKAAELDALAHQKQHADQPFCVCATTPSWDDGELGHNHCRERVCCECGCMTSRRAPEQKGDSPSS